MMMRQSTVTKVNQVSSLLCYHLCDSEIDHKKSK